MAPRDVFWWRFQHRPAQDFRLRRRSYLHAVRKDFTSAPPATSWRPRCRDVPNAREGSRVCAVAFVRSSHTSALTHFRHGVLHALLRTSARRPPTCSPLPHQRRLANAALVSERMGVRVGEVEGVGIRWRRNVGSRAEADMRGRTLFHPFRQGYPPKPVGAIEKLP